MVIDVTTYNSEKDLFEIRYNILKDFVDEFIVIEFDKTFSGKPKERTFFFDLPRVKYFFHTEDVYGKYVELAKSSPNTEYGKGASHWVREWAQKESIKDAITHLNDDDVVFIGDVDEIYNPEHMTYLKTEDTPKKLKLTVYTYFLNNLSTEKFWGTIFGKYKHIKNECLNHLRVNAKRTEGTYGWHFTSQGGYEMVKKKLSDSYTRESYWTDQVETFLEDNIKYSRDFLGRSFTYRVDESGLPDYLINNKQKWIKLFR